MTRDKAEWLRVRFAVHEQEPGELDSRPVKFPPPGPYWVSGTGQGPDDLYYDILIAFVPSVEALLEYWPDADLEWSGSDIQPRAEITFSDRFRKPDWWQGSEPDPATLTNIYNHAAEVFAPLPGIPDAPGDGA